jgi:hypothetical protein
VAVWSLVFFNVLVLTDSEAPRANLTPAMLVWESARVLRDELNMSDRDWLITDPRCLAPGLLAPLYLPSQLQAGTSGFRPWLAPKKGWRVSISSSKLLLRAPPSVVGSLGLEPAIGTEQAKAHLKLSSQNVTIKVVYRIS